MRNRFYLFIVFFASFLQWGTTAAQPVDPSAAVGREAPQQLQALFTERSKEAKITLSYEELARIRFRRGALSRASFLAAVATALATAAIVYQDEGLERRLADGGTCGVSLNPPYFHRDAGGGGREEEGPWFGNGGPKRPPYGGRGGYGGRGRPRRGGGSGGGDTVDGGPKKEEEGQEGQEGSDVTQPGGPEGEGPPQAEAVSQARSGLRLFDPSAVVESASTSSTPSGQGASGGGDGRSKSQRRQDRRRRLQRAIGSQQHSPTKEEEGEEGEEGKDVTQPGGPGDEGAPQTEAIVESSSTSTTSSAHGASGGGDHPKSKREAPPPPRDPNRPVPPPPPPFRPCDCCSPTARVSLRNPASIAWSTMALPRGSGSEGQGEEGEPEKDPEGEGGDGTKSPGEGEPEGPPESDEDFPYPVKVPPPPKVPFGFYQGDDDTNSSVSLHNTASIAWSTMALLVLPRPSPLMWRDASLVSNASHVVKASISQSGGSGPEASASGGPSQPAEGSPESPQPEVSFHSAASIAWRHLGTFGVASPS
ncbi:hypothetical protein Emed_002737 [Eimeria media]